MLPLMLVQGQPEKTNKVLIIGIDGVRPDALQEHTTALSKSPTKEHNLVFNGLAETWDEAMPLGNGMVGCLVWQKDGKLRFSLDRADLWDLRPMENIDFEKWKFEDVYDISIEEGPNVICF